MAYEAHPNPDCVLRSGVSFFVLNTFSIRRPAGDCFNIFFCYTHIINTESKYYTRKEIRHDRKYKRNSIS